MKKKKLFYKDLSGLRFVGTLFIFIYIISYILFSQESAKVDFEYSEVIAAFKNLSISLFFIISAFLQTAHGLREYKYSDTFNLKNFYLRRLLRIGPTLSIALIFFAIIHPAIVSFLNLTPLTDLSIFKQLLFFPTYHLKISNEVFIYLFFIYGIFAILQYYLIWGIILKYFRERFKILMAILFIIGVVFKCIPNDLALAPYFYLPFYFIEIAIGGMAAVLVRTESSIIAKVKNLSTGAIAFIYGATALSSIFLYLFSDKVLLILLAKIILYLLISFYIIEQTYAKHSLFKVRENHFIIKFGNLSYPFILFAPIIAVTVFIAFESIDFDMSSKISLTLYPIICFGLTWMISVVHVHYIERFFEQIRKTFRPS